MEGKPRCNPRATYMKLTLHVYSVRVSLTNNVYSLHPHRLGSERTISTTPSAIATLNEYCHCITKCIHCENAKNGYMFCCHTRVHPLHIKMCDMPEKSTLMAVKAHSNHCRNPRTAPRAQQKMAMPTLGGPKWRHKHHNAMPPPRVQKPTRPNDLH